MPSHVLPTYARAALAFERGEGCHLISTDGERYLDFSAGIAVNAFGHAHPRLVAALTEQAHKLWHVSNIFRIPEQERLAERLCQATFADYVFFTNSGAEAMECAIKTARKYFAACGAPERYRLVTFEGAFHGRTLATIAAGGNRKYLEGFGPPVEGFDQVPYGDIDAVKKAIAPETAGILIEPVQGEGGIRVPPAGFLRKLRALADEHGLLLVMDEIQCGMGRTGRLFAHEWEGVTPDIMAIAKAIGGGFPLGACLATEEAAKGMTAGTHGSTYGGNPLAMAVGSAALDLLLADGFLDHVNEMALKLTQKLAGVADEAPHVIETVRGKGLMLGIKSKVPSADLVAALYRKKMLAVGAGDNVVRLLPPLITGEAEVEEAVEKLAAACAAIPAESAAAAAKGG